MPKAVEAADAKAEAPEMRTGRADRGGLPEAPRGDRPAQAGADVAVRARAANWRRLRHLIIAAVALVAIAGGAAYWLHARDYESTDDAFIDGDTVQISPRVAGAVVRLNVTDNQSVRQGDLVLVIDPRDYEAALSNAKAALEEAAAQEATARANLDLTRATTEASVTQARSGVEVAKASLAQAKAQVVALDAEARRAAADAQRYQALMRSDFASRQRLEQAIAAWHSGDAQLKASQHAVEVAEAQIGEAEGRLAQADTAAQQVAVKEAELRSAAAHVAAARAAVETAELNLSYTKIYAPHDGVITKRSVQEGDVVQKDQALAALVFGTPYVTANFKETQLTYMRPGQPADIVIDAYPHIAFKGHIDSIQRGTGAHFSLLPPENATGNFVKIVKRVPVKIVFDVPPDPKLVLGLGMSVVPRVKVRGDGVVAGKTAGE